MEPIILDGLALSKVERKRIADQLLARATHTLAVVLCTEDPASHLYVQRKQEACEDVGINSVLLNPFGTLGAKNCSSPLKRLVSMLDWLSNDSSIDGILLQLPLPQELLWHKYEIFDHIHPLKDVDVLNSQNVAKLVQGRSSLLPCTPQAVIELLVAHGITIPEKKVTIINRSDIVGKPLASLLVQDNERGNATVCMCHDRTPYDRLVEACQWADIIVVAVGKRNFLRESMVGPGKVIVDVGINREGKRIYGDVSPDLCAVSSHYTPVPGGVGPMTITCLLRNTLVCRDLASK